MIVLRVRDGDEQQMGITYALYIPLPYERFADVLPQSIYSYVVTSSLNAWSKIQMCLETTGSSQNYRIRLY